MKRLDSKESGRFFLFWAIGPTWSKRWSYSILCVGGQSKCCAFAAFSFFAFTFTSRCVMFIVARLWNVRCTVVKR